MHRSFLAAFALLVSACGQEADQPAANNEAQAEAEGPVKGVDRSHKGEAAPDAKFTNPDGEEISLPEFRGVPVAVNLWATWWQSDEPEVVRGQADAGEPVGDLVRTVREGAADAQCAGPHA